jgi:hypothetical protein
MCLACDAPFLLAALKDVKYQQRFQGKSAKPADVCQGVTEETWHNMTESKT